MPDVTDDLRSLSRIGVRLEVVHDGDAQRFAERAAWQIVDALDGCDDVDVLGWTTEGAPVTVPTRSPQGMELHELAARLVVGMEDIEESVVRIVERIERLETAGV